MTSKSSTILVNKVKEQKKANNKINIDTTYKISAFASNINTKYHDEPFTVTGINGNNITGKTKSGEEITVKRTNLSNLNN